MAIRENPDKKHAEEVKRRLKENGGFCPCCIYKEPDTKCMCKAFREQKEGMCHCGLYIKS